MTRHAYLVGGQYRKSLSGVSLDIAAWKNYLLSAIGGSWYADEIEDLSGVDSSVILEEIARGAQYDYTVVCFAGHGGVMQDGLGFYRTYLYINDDELLCENDLNPGSARAMLFLDNCRTKIVPELVNAAMNSLREHFSQCNTRPIYEREILRAELGCATVYSAGLNQAAADNPSFTRTLIATAQNNNWSNWTGDDGVLRINDAVRLCAEVMPPQQVPEYNGGRRLRHFPFAIKPLIV